MAQTEAERRAKRKWAAKNEAVLGCKVRRDDVPLYHAAAAQQGTKVNAVLKRALDELLEGTRAGAPDVAAGPIVPAEHLERTGETAPAFLARAVDAQIQRDNLALRMGIDPTAKEAIK